MTTISQTSYAELTKFRQRIVKEGRNKYILISHINDVQDTIKIDMKNCDQTQLTKTNIEDVVGYLERSNINEWLSKNIGFDVLLLRSSQSILNPLDLKVLFEAKKEDLRRNFITVASLHIVNEASTVDLRERVLQQYSTEERSKFEIQSTGFRPNIVIDTKVPYEEDKFKEARIENIFIRLVGHCARCKAVTNNYQTQDRNPQIEPYPTLLKYRKNKKIGILFGTYYQVEILNQNELRDLSIEKTENRTLDHEYALIKKSDLIKVRVIEEVNLFD